MQQLALLWSINERLGGNAGLNIPQLSTDWIDDLIDMVDLESADPNDENSETKNYVDSFEDIIGV